MKYLLIAILFIGCMTEKKLAAYLQKNNYVKGGTIQGGISGPGWDYPSLPPILTYPFFRAPHPDTSKYAGVSLDTANIIFKYLK